MTSKSKIINKKNPTRQSNKDPNTDNNMIDLNKQTKKEIQLINAQKLYLTNSEK